jgi:hypothetical protein
VWHRVQVVAIFAFFGLVLLVASPLLLLALPCLLCFHCKLLDRMQAEYALHGMATPQAAASPAASNRDVSIV